MILVRICAHSRELGLTRTSSVPSNSADVSVSVFIDIYLVPLAENRNHKLILCTLAKQNLKSGGPYTEACEVWTLGRNGIKQKKHGT